MKSVDEFHVNHEIERIESIRTRQIMAKDYFAAMEILYARIIIKMKTNFVP